MQFQEFIEDQVFRQPASHKRCAPPSPRSPAPWDLERTPSREPRASARGRHKPVCARCWKSSTASKPRLGRRSPPMPGSAPSRCPGFGGATPDQLLREGKAEHVHAYLDRIMAGGYA